jgi:16S rRNA (guanine966-N2)-methyltransferase
MVRVIAGEFRSRKLKTPDTEKTRPTPDRLRESLFSILTPYLEGCVFVDAYAGSGSMGIEALSRGAARVIFIERNKAAADVIRENLTSLGIMGRAKVVQGATVAYLAAQVGQNAETDLVFIDPPYALEDDYLTCLEILAGKEFAIALLQHAAKMTLPETVGALTKTRVVRQGDNSVSFYQHVLPE